MKFLRKPKKPTLKDTTPRSQGHAYKNIGSLIRMGIYDGVSEDNSTLLRNQYDTEIGEVDSMFRFCDPSIGVDKFDRATIHAKKVAEPIPPTPTETPAPPIESPTPAPTPME